MTGIAVGIALANAANSLPFTDRFIDRNDRKYKKNIISGGEGGIRTPDRGVSPYNGLANRRLQPLGHLSGVLRLQILYQSNGHLQQLAFS
jgi:hypothetical protein